MTNSIRFVRAVALTSAVLAGMLGLAGYHRAALLPLGLAWVLYFFPLGSFTPRFWTWDHANLLLLFWGLLFIGALIGEHTTYRWTGAAIVFVAPAFWVPVAWQQFVKGARGGQAENS